MLLTIKSYLKSVLLAMAGGIFLLTCTNDKLEADGYSESDSALVQLKIHTPASSIPSVTRNAAADESTVSKVKIIVLEDNGGTFRYGYMTNGRQIMQSMEDEQTTTFNALLRSSDSPLKILLIANYNDAFDADVFVEGMTEEQLRMLLIDSFDKDMAGNIPLYGEITLASLKTDQPTPITATMLRVIARVDVNNTIDTEFSESFRMETVYIYRANDRLALIPDPSAIKQGSFSVASPTVPSGALKYPAYMTSTTSESIEKIYLPESLSLDASGNKVLDPTCIVVGGYFADDVTPSYYRIDFNSGIDGHPFGQVLRNHKYIFNIIQVGDRGWENPDDAAENEATSITATVQVWDETTSEMYFGCNDNYLGISSRHITLNYFKGSERKVKLQTTVAYSIQQLDVDGNVIGPAISSIGESITTDFYTLEIQKNADDNNDIHTLLITSTGKNDTDKPFNGSFRVYTDFWIFDVVVEQETYIEIYNKRYIKILAITDLLGDLGSTDGTFTEKSGAAMRNVLENTENFSPTGIIPIGGVIVYDLKNSTIASSSSSQLFILEKILETVDVVHLPYLCEPSVEASKMIYDWVVESPNRFLIVGMDDPTTTNKNLYPYFTSDGTWFANDGQVTQIGTAYAEESNRVFFEGPFGSVPERTSMGHVKSLIGFTNGYNWETTIPIMMVTEGTNIEQMMTHGVNMETGVFYFGESGVTTSQGNAMSASANDSGIVESEFDILMANVWAWLLERIIKD